MPCKNVIRSKGLMTKVKRVCSDHWRNECLNTPAYVAANNSLTWTRVYTATPIFVHEHSTPRHIYTGKYMHTNIYICVRVTSRNCTLARFGDFDFSPSAVSTTPSAPFCKVSELGALARCRNSRVKDPS